MEPLKFEAFCVHYLCRASDCDLVGGGAMMMINAMRKMGLQ